jgi:hypothetical protein
MARSVVFAVALLVNLGLSGCSSEESIDVPNGPDSFRIAKIEAVASGDSATEDGASLIVGCSPEPVLVHFRPKLDDEDRLGDFVLAPPGSCGTTVDCGWIELNVLDSDGNSILEEPIISAQLPIAVDLPEDKRNGVVTFHAELRDADNNPVLVPDTEKPLEAELEVELFSVCVTP